MSIDTLAEKQWANDLDRYYEDDLDDYEDDPDFDDIDAYPSLTIGDNA